MILQLASDHWGVTPLCHTKLVAREMLSRSHRISAFLLTTDLILAL